MGSMPEDNFDGPPNTLVVHAIEKKAQSIPHHTFMRYAPADWEGTGYRTMTWRQYANAIDRVAYWLDQQLGEAAHLDTVAYHGPNDARYAILVPACIKSGRKLLLPDGRVTQEGLASLFMTTKCKTWIHAEDDRNEPLVKSALIPQNCALPPLDWILQDEEPKQYPYAKTFEQAAWDEIVIIHTSGTTGVPKPIYHTNGMWSAVGNFSTLSKRHWPQGIAYESWMGRSALNPCPPQWIAGLHAMILSPTFLDSTCILTPPDVVSLSADVFKKICKMNQVDGIKCPPHTIVTLYEDPETQPLLKSMDFLVYLGAPLARAIGDDLCQYTRLTSIIGSTETGDQISLRPADRKLWYTHAFPPENGHQMIHVDADGGSADFHELVFDSSDDGRTNPFQLAFWNPAYRGVKRIETKELYTPVKDSDGRTRWVFAARKDDLTKLNWLAKFHATDIESRIQQHAGVQGVFVGGQGRPTPYVLVEVKEGVLDQKSEEQLLSELYAGVIARTNEVDIDEIRIPRETIMVASKEKPFKRNRKNAVLRKEVEEDYLEEIEQAYLRLKNAKKA